MFQKMRKFFSGKMIKGLSFLFMLGLFGVQSQTASAAALCVTDPQLGLCPLTVSLTPAVGSVPPGQSVSITLVEGGILQLDVTIADLEVWMIDAVTADNTPLTWGGGWPTYGQSRTVNTGALTHSVTVYARAMNSQGVEAMTSVPITVLAGTINVSSNIAGASYTITGPATLNGSGVSNSHANQPTGGYTITWNDVAGYTKPGSSSQTLSSGGTISFVGNYSGVAPTCSYTGPINWVEPTGLECSVGVSYNSVPVGGQRTATDSNASGNGYTGSITFACDGSGNWQYVSHVCNAPAPTINVNF